MTFWIDDAFCPKQHILDLIIYFSLPQRLVECLPVPLIHHEQENTVPTLVELTL